MWLLFFVVVLVIAFLMVFLLMAIRMLAGQAKTQLNRYFLKNLETYDRLAEHKNEEIDGLQKELKELEARVEQAGKRLAAMTEVSGGSSERTASAGNSMVMMDTSGASYRDPGFLADYAYVRRNLKLDYKQIVKEVLERLDREQDPEYTLCKSMLEKLPEDHLYELVTRKR